MVKDWREKRGLSQNELAKKSGVPQSVIAYIENGKTKSPRIDTLNALAKTLNCSLGDLISTQSASDRGQPA